MESYIKELQPYILKGVVPTGKQLGHGAFGSVIEMRMVGGALCAGKKFHDVLIDPQNVGVQKMKFVSECDLMSKMHHLNIVSFYGLVFLDNAPTPILVMEMLDQSLEDYIEKVQPKDVTFSSRVSILSDVAKGLVFLHCCDPPIVHRDLTARNILLTTTKQAKIADLGNCCVIDTETILKTLTRAPDTLAYMPPEILEITPKYDTSLDMFSFGQVSLYTLTHVSPNHLLSPTYSDTTGKILIARTEVERRAQYIERLHANEMIPPHICNMVEACLENIPQNRPTAMQVTKELDELLKVSEVFKEVRKKIGTFRSPSEVDMPTVPNMAEDKRKSSDFMKRIITGSPCWLEMKTVHGGFGRRRATPWRKYMFELKGKLLKYCKLNDTEYQVLRLDDVDNVAPFNSKFRFQFVIMSKKKEDIFLRAETKDERNCWVQALCDSIGLNCELSFELSFESDLQPPAGTEGEQIGKIESKLLGEILKKLDVNLEPFGINIKELTEGRSELTYEELQYVLKKNQSTQNVFFDNIKENLKSRLLEEKLYEEAIANDQKVSICYTKILALGPGQVGKSTFLYRLMGIMKGNIKTANPKTQPQCSTGIAEMREACITYTSRIGAISSNSWQVFDKSSDLQCQFSGLLSQLSEQAENQKMSQLCTEQTNTDETKSRERIKLLKSEEDINPSLERIEPLTNTESIEQTLIVDELLSLNCSLPSAVPTEKFDIDKIITKFNDIRSTHKLATNQTHKIPYNV